MNVIDPQLLDALDDPEREQFSVYIFYDDGSYEAVERYVKLEPAKEIMERLVSTNLKLWNRLIITDGGDFIVFEWKEGQGVTWPKLQGNKNGEIHQGTTPGDSLKES